MSKKRIDETVTKARQAREKKAREQAETEATVELLVTKDGIEKVSGETPDAATNPKPTVAEWMAAQGDEKAAIAAAMAAEEVAHTDADAATESEATGKKTRRLAVVPDAPTAPTEDLVVFAMRLTTDERDAIHKAAGPGKASKFVRQVAIAAARGDVDAVQRLIDARMK
jgi:hypothetical protein